MRPMIPDYGFRPEPPKPPAPTTTTLREAPPAQARAMVGQMTPQQQQALKGEVRQMPLADRQRLANDLAKKLEAPQLVQLEPVFGQDDIEHAVSTYGSAKLQADYKVAHLAGNPKLKSGLDKLGLTPEDISNASEAATPKLVEAAQALADNDTGKALQDLQAAAKAGSPLATKAFTHVAEGLSGPAKTILTDENVAKQLIDAAPGTIDKLVKGDLAGALKGLGDNKPLRDALIDAAVKDPGIKGNLDKLGLGAADLKQAADAAPSLLNAATLAGKSDWPGAALALADAGKQAPELVAKGLKAAAEHLPEPVKSVLGDDKVAEQLAKSSPDALKDFINGDVGAGLGALGGNKDLRDAVIDAAMKNPAFKGKIDSIGLDANDLKQAGDAIPHLLDAATAMSANPPDVNAALKAFGEVGKAAPDLLAKVGGKIYDKLPAGTQEKLQGLGITRDQLKEGAAALPHFVEAAQAIANKDWKGAIDALFKAGEAAPKLTQAALQKLGAQIPPGKCDLVKQLLADDTVSKELAGNTDLHDAIDQLLDGKTLEGASKLLHNDTVRDAVLDVVGKDPAVAKALDKAGLTPEEFRQAGAATPHLLDAAIALSANPPDVDAALKAFGEVGKAAPDLLAKVGGKIYDKLPASTQEKLQSLGITRDQLKEGAAALPHFVEAAQAIANKDWKGAINALLDAGEAAPTLAQAAIKKLGAQLPENFGLVKKLLGDDAVVKELATNADLHDAIGQLLDGKTVEGVGKLLHNDAIRGSVLDVVSQDPQVGKLLDRIGLTPEEFRQAGDASPHLFDAAVALSNGKWDDAIKAFGAAGAAAPDLLKKVGNKLVDQMPQGVKDKLGSLGLTTDDLKDAGAALPHVIAAVADASQTHWLDALKELGQAVDAAPELVTKAINAAAGKLDADNPKTRLLRSILTDHDLVKTLIGDPSLRGSLGQLLEGKVSDGLRGIGNNATVMAQVGRVLAKDPDLMARLKPLGIVSADDIAQLGPAMADCVDLADAIKVGNIGDAIKSLGAAIKDLPDGTRNKLIDAIADKFKIKPELKELLKGSLEALSNPQVADALGQAFDAFGKGDPVAFVKALANVGETITKEAPDLAVGFLDTLKHLPGTVGKFFSNPDLNAAIVKSGSLPHIFAAVEKLAGGDVSGAISELGKSFTTLLGAGDHFSVAGVDLPFGKEGLEAVGGLFKQFVECMPDKVKTKLEEKIATAVAGAGFKSIPFIGPLVGVVGAGKDLIGDISDHKDGLSIALDTANLVINGAGLIPGVSAFTGPLRTVLGVAQAVNDVAGFVGDMQDFGQQFTGMA
ncbi:hypothetical protein ASG87_02905 [Frateuria sp. Soil773]|uniref:hypothetical protein n=1 Tax=Frateuria sp. Soil773 TaxID=1736407 RepID=UPI0006F6108C|nr:hypothetical protein [Frateuria sp. Soil773]KRE89308.1 hypothetical protein ASG87_02905 [Frateuria sp. Soil773]